MYDPHFIPPETLAWVMENAQNELNAYLCEVDFYKVNGDKWPQMAREQAFLCREIAAAATRPEEKESWLDLAHLYESTIEKRTEGECLESDSF
jgi:hypothetical protein